MARITIPLSPGGEGNCQTPSWRVCDYPHRHETLHFGVCGNPLSLPGNDVDAIEVPKDLDRLGYYAGIPASLPSCLYDADWNGESVVQQDIDRGLWGQNIVRMALAGDILHQPDIPSPQLPLGAVAGPHLHLRRTGGQSACNRAADEQSGFHTVIDDTGSSSTSYSDTTVSQDTRYVYPLHQDPPALADCELGDYISGCRHLCF